MEELGRDKIDLFEKMPVSKAVMKLSIPTVLGCIVMILYNLADAYFVGMLNDPIQTAAVSLSGPILLLFNAITNLFGTGTSSMISRALGLKDFDTVRKSSAFGFYMGGVFAIAFGAIFSAFKPLCLEIMGADIENIAFTSSYLYWTVSIGILPSVLNVILSNLVRAEGGALHASLGVMSGCLLNIILDPFFILPGYLGMGVEGAGLATFISNVFACTYYFLLLFYKRKKMYVSIHPKYFVMDKKIAGGIFSVGVPASIQNMLNVAGMTILNNLMGEYGSEALAAAGIAHRITMVPVYITMGVGQGIAPLAGYNFSAKNGKRLRDTVKFTTKIALCFMATATVLFIIFSEPLVSLFIQDETTIAFGSAFVIGMSLCQPFFTMDFIAVGVFQSCGFGSKSLVYALLRKLAFEIPALFLLDAFFPMYGLPYAQLVSEVIMSVLAVFSLKKVFHIADGNT